MPTDIRIGIVGAGLMGREIAAAIQRWPALIDHPVTPRIVGVCDVNPAALEWFRQIPSVEVFASDYRELLADDRIDVLYIAVRHDLHEGMYVDTIRAGKHLLGEKPFGIDVAAARAIVEAIDASSSFVRCSSEMPFFPGALAAYEYARSGKLGRVTEARSSFLHSSDLDLGKPINWKRQAQFCGEAGVMNDLGMHAWHVPLRLGWRPDSVTGVLQNIVPTRVDASGASVPCDTWDNATVIGRAGGDAPFPLTIETKRIALGEKNTWVFEASGLDGGIRFSTKNPKRVEVFGFVDGVLAGREQAWSSLDSGSQSVWPTVTGPNFEFGFSDAILQMWAAYFAELVGELGDRFGTARPEEALAVHELSLAATRSALMG
jgi:predicted dehydrogenase